MKADMKEANTKRDWCMQVTFVVEAGSEGEACDIARTMLENGLPNLDISNWQDVGIEATEVEG